MNDYCCYFFLTDPKTEMHTLADWIRLLLKHKLSEMWFVFYVVTLVTLPLGLIINFSCQADKSGVGND